MISYAALFKTAEAENTYFAGANTPRGFVSDYGSLLSEDTFTKVYIIKGGSGTGKSTLIRRSAAAASLCGAEITLLLCGSDPDSLDGVIIEKDECRIAVIDGTAPHTLDPVYAGACGEIINCGSYWNAALLEKQKAEISDISGKKSMLHGKCYRYLSAAAEITALQQKTARTYLLGDKMDSCISRLLGSKSGSGHGRKITRRTSCISMKGARRLESFEKAENIIGVSDFWSLSPFFFVSLQSKLQEAGYDTVVSESPLFGISEIYVPETNTSFVPSYPGKNYNKIINMQRFADKNAFSAVRQKQRFASKCICSMFEGALDCLGEIGELHFRLEAIYKKAMNFKGLDSLSDELCGLLRSKLN